MPHSLAEFARDTVPQRAACLAAGELNKICPLAAHVWLYEWILCGFPIFRIGSLCKQDRQIFLICFAHLKEPMKFNVFSLADYEDYLFDLSCEVELLPTPLAFACILRDEPKRLEKLSKDVLSVVSSGISALHYAASLGAVDCLSVLIERLGVSVDLKLLHCCDARFPFGDRLGVLDLLLERGNLNIFEHRHGLDSIFKSAAFYGADWLISYLLSHFGDGLDKISALCDASKKGHIECCRLLIESGADVNEKTEDGRAALMDASQNGHAHCCRVLIDSGADVNLQREYGWAALMDASERGHADCCKVLIDSGADLNVQTSRGWTALMWTCCDGYADCCKVLIDSGADVNIQTSRGRTALTHASDQCHAKCCRLLIDSGADVNQQDDNGSTALMRASRNGHAECCRLLIDSGADANLQREYGWTALMDTAQKGHAGCCKVLVDSGADLSLQEAGGWTALMYAKIHHHAECCQLLMLSSAARNTPP